MAADQFPIRPATAFELPVLQDIERAAGEVFRDIGMAAVADDEPLSIQDLTPFLADERILVSLAGDRPVGYLLIEIVDAAAHIEQVSVHPDWSRRGIGRRLIDEADSWAARQLLEALTLTTFTDVPWNAAYYRRLGFTDVDDAELAPGLRAVRDHEAAIGLDAWPRIAMRRDVRSGHLPQQ